MFSVRGIFLYTFGECCRQTVRAMHAWNEMGKIAEKRFSFVIAYKLKSLLLYGILGIGFCHQAEILLIVIVQPKPDNKMSLSDSCKRQPKNLSNPTLLGSASEQDPIPIFQSAVV